MTRAVDEGTESSSEHLGHPETAIDLAVSNILYFEDIQLHRTHKA
jgi:hypothetical protein